MSANNICFYEEVGKTRKGFIKTKKKNNKKQMRADKKSMDNHCQT